MCRLEFGRNMEFDSGSAFKNAFAAECDDVVHSPMADRRDEERQLSVRLTAKIIVAGRELPCRVHNISSGGANIETLAKLTTEDRLRIEFRSNLSLAGKVRWQNGTFAGIEFTEPADVDAVLKKSGISIARIKPRLPRYGCKVPAKLITEQQTIECEAIDISTNGVRLGKIKQLKPGESYMLVIEGLSRRKVSMVWNRDDQAGVKFVNPLRFDEFENWIAWNQGEMVPQ
ncbi:PilZ domain-containing protein [Sphingorhabdus pulchriflava]|uniref:PilZ domain-containing protein n=2 Tax=Sphingorhabdus pulchriflava TaxID=2292257 RepID=A0A371BHR3_9SPHN|nr:PilZ domain-containing protein [Sphingorhabdus pulchriflava]